MDDKHFVSQLVSDLAIKDRRTKKRHLAYTIAAMSVGVLWIVLSFFELRQLETAKAEKIEELEKKTQQIRDMDGEIEIKDKEIADKTSAVNALDHMLKNTLFAGEISQKEQDRLVRESDKAQAQLTRTHSLKPEMVRRSHITIQYYSREIEKHYVDVAMKRLAKDYGFKPLPPHKPSEPNTPTNAVWLNRGRLTEEDIKLVAYYLTVAGISIKYIGPPTSTCDKFRGLLMNIVVVAEPKVSNEQPLGVDRIRDLSLQDMKAGTKKVDCR